MVIKVNPKLHYLQFEEIDDILIAKVDYSRSNWKLIERQNFYYYAYTYIKDIYKVKILDFLGFTFKKGGIVGVSLKDTPQQKDKESVIKEIRHSIKKLKDLTERLNDDQIIRTVEEYYKIMN